MTGFHYVYMLSDVATHTHHYVGMTEDLKARLAKHNSGLNWNYSQIGES